MTSILTLARLPDADTRQYFFWRHPEWWSLALCSSAWAVMLLHDWQHGGHAVHGWMPFRQELAFWMLMVAAMMLPMVLYSIRVTATGSLWRRRHRAIAGFLAGYFAPWLALGTAAAGLRELALAHTYAAPALGFVAAAYWLRTRFHHQALIACHRRAALAPTGWRADRDCLRFGTVIGAACVLSCWPMMLACALAGHGLIAMVGGMALGISERRWVRSHSWQMIAATLALAGYYLAMAGLNWRSTTTSDMARGAGQAICLSLADGHSYGQAHRIPHW